MGEILVSLYLKLMPRALLSRVRKINHLFRKSIYNIKAFYTQFTINSAFFLKDSVSQLKKSKQVFTEKADLWSQRLKQFNKRLKSFLLNSPLKTTINNFEPIRLKIKEKTSRVFSKEKAPYYVLAGSAATMVTLGIIAVAQQSRLIYLSENPNRKPASIQQYDVKPEYYYYKKQTTMVQNIKVPLQVSSVAQMDSLTIDFSVRTSTRYASYFLKENEHRLKDYFFTSVEPIVSDFALDEDGKEVLKEKIQIEIQNFLDKEKVEGKVLEVNLQYVIGS